MIISCTNCATKFKVGDDKFKAGSIKVRCSKCKTVFSVSPPLEKKKPLPPPAADVDSDDVSLDFDLDGDSGLAGKLEPKDPPSPPATAIGPSSSEFEIDIDFDTPDLPAQNAPSAPRAPSPPPPKKPPPASKSKGGFVLPEGGSEDLFENIPGKPIGVPQTSSAPARPRPSPLPESPTEFIITASGTENTIGGADSMAALDEGLNNFLDESALQSGSHIPLTMPSDIDLNDLAESHAPPPKVTNEGIELVDNLSALNSPQPRARPSATAPDRSPSLSETLSLEDPLDSVAAGGGLTDTPFATTSFADQMDFTPPGAAQTPLPPPTPKPHRVVLPTDSSRTNLAFESSSSPIKKIAVFLFLLILIAAGTLAFAMFRVHGNFSVEHANLDTLSAFAKSFSSEKSPRGSSPNGKRPSERSGPTELKIQNTSTTLVRNVDNQTLLVISGEVLNGYESPRSFIQIRALMFSASEKKLAEREVWAGNYFSRDEIFYFTSQDEIDQKYNKMGKSLANMNITPGNSVPFQVIVLNPPRDWDQFDVVPGTSQASAGS